MRAALLLQCADRPGIVAAVGAFVADARRQHRRGRPALRPRRGAVPPARRVRRRHVARRPSPRLRTRRRRASTWTGRCTTSRRAPRVAVLVSRQGHCLADLLVRVNSASSPGEIVLVASNHDTHAELVERFGVPFRHVPVGDGARRAGARTRAAARRGRTRRRRARPLHARPSPVVRRAVAATG